MADGHAHTARGGGISPSIFREAAEAMSNALDAVEKLHSEGIVAGESRCNACSAPERGYIVPWPCPTREAIMRAINEAVDRG